MGQIMLSALGMAAASGAAIVIDGSAASSPLPAPAPRRSVYRKPKGDFDPRINRWTGKPHEHKREIARRARQQGRA
jgi:hypothetical protein